MKKDGREEPEAPLESLVVRPIGVVRSPFGEKVSAPRQPAAARGVEGRIELFARSGMEHAVADLESCDHVWVVFWFHRAHDFRPKVLPPRSAGRRRGVLATRSPHRPNPIGLSVVRLTRVDGLTLHIRDVDMLDGTPVLDVKPYLPYADSVPHARVGWLLEGAGEEQGEGSDGFVNCGSRVPLREDPVEGAEPVEPVDPVGAYEVTFAAEAAEVLGLLKASFGVDLGPAIVAVLSLGPQPHPYRRIRRVDGGRLVLAVKDWRARFEAEGRRVRVVSIETGYRPKQLVEGVPGMGEEALAPHRAVWERERERAAGGAGNKTS